MEDENFVQAYAYDYGYPYYAHPYQSAACPTWLAKNHARTLYLDGENGDHGVFATESPWTEGCEGNQSSKQTESAFLSTEAPTYSYLVKIIPPTNKRRATVHELPDVTQNEASQSSTATDSIVGENDSSWSVREL